MNYKNGKSTVKRIPKRAHYDADTIYPIIDEAILCHISFSIDNQPYLIPTIHSRIDDIIYIHGLKGGRMLKHIQQGNQICIAMTLVDGLVLARSVFHHSMNYRSVVIFGTGRVVDNIEEKSKALEKITNHILKGRWDESRLPNDKELKMTSVIAINIDSASAKVRTGEPVDDDEDYELAYWAGVLPVATTFGNAQNDTKLKEGIQLPNSINKLLNP